MDFGAALLGPDFATDGETLALALSMEQDRAFSSITTDHYGESAGEPTGLSPEHEARHRKLVYGLVGGVFLFADALAWYLMVT
jgi:hypothetical protein